MLITTQNTHYQKAIQFLEKGCKCGCSAQLPKEKFAQLRVQFQNLSKSSQDTFIMAQLLAMNEGNITTSSRFPKRERINTRTFYRWDNKIPICRLTYLNLLGISKKYLEVICHELAHQGLVERVHGNIGRSPQWKTKAAISQSVKDKVRNFILNYAETNGSPDPGRNKSKNHPIIFLPTHTSYKSVHRDFIASQEENSDLKQLKYEAFRRLWHQLTPHIKFMSPRSDLCDTCCGLANELHSCSKEEKKEEFKKNF